MKVGDLIRLNELYGFSTCTELYTDAFMKDRYSPDRFSGVQFRRGELGMIIQVEKWYSNISSDKLYKILVPFGTGWAYAHWIESAK